MQDNNIPLGLRYYCKQSHHQAYFLFNGSIFEPGTFTGDFILLGKNNNSYVSYIYGIEVNQAYIKQAKNIIIKKIKSKDRFYIDSIYTKSNPNLSIDVISDEISSNASLFKDLLELPSLQDAIATEILTNFNNKKKDILKSSAIEILKKGKNIDSFLEDNYFTYSQANESLVHSPLENSEFFKILIKNRYYMNKIILNFKSEIDSGNIVNKCFFEYNHSDKYSKKIKFISLIKKIFHFKKNFFTLNLDYKKIFSCLINDLSQIRGLNLVNKMLIMSHDSDGNKRFLTYSPWISEVEKINLNQVLTESHHDYLQPNLTDIHFSENHMNHFGVSMIWMIMLKLLIGEKLELSLLGLTPYSINFKGKPLYKKIKISKLPDDLNLIHSNFSLDFFKDISLIDKVKGLYITQRLRTGQLPSTDILNELDHDEKNLLSKININEDLNIIDCYLKNFPFIKEKLISFRKRLVEIDIMILEKFKFYLSYPLSALSIKDNLEKLTSSVISHENKIFYNYLHFSNHSKCVWNIDSKKNQYTFSTNDLTAIDSFNLYIEQNKISISSLIIDKKSFSISKDDLNILYISLSENNIAKYKKLDLAIDIKNENFEISEQVYDRLNSSINS